MPSALAATEYLQRVTKKPRKDTTGTPGRMSSRSAPWRIHFYERHVEDDAKRSVPGRDFLLACPEKVRTLMLAVLKAVAEAPPPIFAGGGKWEAMHGDMHGFYEVRVDGAGRRHYRLFCVLECDGGNLGLGGPSVVILVGKDKPFRTTLAAKDYAEVRPLGAELQGPDAPKRSRLTTEIGVTACVTYKLRMARAKKTGFDKFFNEQMRDPKIAASYAKARAEIDAVDRIVRALDQARVDLGMNKAELAALISAKPEIVRRLFTSKSPNPTLSTVVKLAEAVGLKLTLAGTPHRSRPPRRAA